MTDRELIKKPVHIVEKDKEKQLFRARMRQLVCAIVRQRTTQRLNAEYEDAPG